MEQETKIIFENFKNELIHISDTLKKNEWVQSVRNAKEKSMQALKKLTLSPWSPGLGRAVSKGISDITDLCIQKSLDFIDGIHPEMALLAIGGYGRAEMAPYSDVDILLLHPKNIDPKDAGELFYLLWDLGFKLGNSVRTLSNTVEHSGRDLTLLTAVLEPRILSGDPNWLPKLSQAIAPVLKNERESYIQTKLAEFQAWSRSPGRTVLLKEPDIKENPGGLRSLHLLRWMTVIFEGRGGMEAVASLLDPLSFRKINVAYDFLMHLRNILHFHVGRKEDKLLIEHHESVSEILKIRGEGLARMRRMMHKVYNKSMDIFLISSYSLDRLFHRHKKFHSRKIKSNFTMKGREFFVNDNVKPDPLTALKAILLCNRQSLLYSYNFIRYLRASAYLIDSKTRVSRTLFDSFIDILSLPNASEALNVMKLSGYLYKYIPGFEGIRHLIIYNPFHTYTVDEHSIEAIHALESLDHDSRNPFSVEKFGLLRELAEQNRDALWLVKLALLVHDIGKAYPGDHSKNGVEICETIFKEIPLPFRYKHLIRFLVEQHLILSEISRRSDIQNPRVIKDLSRLFSLTPYPKEYLDFLYLMTYADINATGPKTYNGYTSSLLKTLYLHTRDMLRGNVKMLNARERSEKLLQQADIKDKKHFEDFIAHMGERYLLQNTDAEIIEDFENYLRHSPDGVALTVEVFNGRLKIRFYAPDSQGLAAGLCGVLLLNGANIVRSSIHTFRNYAIDSFTVTEIFGADLSKESMKNELDTWRGRIETNFHKMRNDPDFLAKKINALRQRFKKQPELFLKTPVITVTTQGKDYLIGLSGSDRPALLYDIMRLLSEKGFNIRSAIIDTVGWHIKDFLQVTAHRDFEDIEELKTQLTTLMRGKE